MSGPKHLWAGDWERESEAVSRRHPPAPPADTEPEPRPSARVSGARRPSRRSLVAALGVVAALALIAGAAVGLSGQGRARPAAGHRVASVPTVTLPAPPTLSPPPQQTIPQVAPPQTIPQPAPPSGNSASPPTSVVIGPVVYWLGMQIQTTGPGDVVIDTVRLGSEADRVGLEPGEQLLAVNGHQLQRATDIASALRGVPAGGRITIEVAFGSANPQTVALTLGDPPSVHP